MGHPNEEVARRAWHAFTERDQDKIVQTFAEDMQYHLGGDTALAGTRKGRDEFLGLADAVPDLKPSFELHDVVANEEHAVILFTVHHEREGKGTLDAPGVWVTHIADGNVAEIWSFPFDQAAAKEFLS
ncbi:MAG: nuclear transport factor 2 family protein [Actinobacteria bacterium]|nr:MAG: nuclear transport factor 2 family protein [Actinomycetota bacterium]REK33760.1 MAG: nuclear transport factor 2 family protein [Actinomycetota bacterium]